MEGVGVQAVGAADLSHQFGVDDGELKTELLAHLVLPLQREAGRADDDGGAGAVTQEQLLNHQTGLDGLAETDVVCEQQVSARCGKCAAQGFELVCLHVDARPERRLVTIGVGTGDRTPAHRINEACECGRLVESVGVDDIWETLSRRDGVAYLQLPHDGELLAESVLVERLEVDDV